ncbi:MAG: transposase [Thermoplasmata archaeon]|nr:transposase [Thermoplasmata archaeon]
MWLTFKFRLHPLPAIEAELLRWLEELRFLHNYVLEQRSTAWRSEHRSVSYLEQQSALTKWRAFDVHGLGSLPYDPARDILQRVDLAFRAFFLRVRDGGPPGYPRFRRELRSLSFGQPDSVLVSSKTIRVPRLGRIAYVRHRPVPPNGVLKRATLLREARAWFVALAYEFPDPPAPPTTPPTNAVGVDLGLTHLATLSDGTTIDPPKFLRRSEERLARAQRSLARKTRGSHRREKARMRVAACHAKIRRQRRDFAHKLTSHWASRHDLIAFEDLDISRLQGRGLGKAFADAGWGMLREMARYKLARASHRFVEVPSKGTSQICSVCGRWANPPLPLGAREFVCPGGHRMDRDLNASRNVLARGRDEVGRNSAELTRGEREPPPGRVGRTVYQPRRARSGSREPSLTRNREPPPGGVRRPEGSPGPER